MLRSGAGGSADDGFSNSMLAALERDGIGPGPGSTAARRPRTNLLLAVLAVGVLGAVVGSGVAFVAHGHAPDRELSIASMPSTPVAPIAPEPRADPRPSATAVASQAGAGAGNAAPLAPAPLAPAPLAPAPLAPAPLASAPPATAQIETASVVAAAAPEPSPPGDAASGSAASRRGGVEPSSLPAPSRSKPVARVAAGRVLATAALPARAGTARADAHDSTGQKALRSDNDADTDLVAALIARLDRRGADPAPSPGRIRHEDDAGLAGRVRVCGSKSDAAEARRCRDRVCEGHWGRGDACDASRAPRQPLDSSVDAVQPD